MLTITKNEQKILFIIREATLMLEPENKRVWGCQDTIKGSIGYFISTFYGLGKRPPDPTKKSFPISYLIFSAEIIEKKLGKSSFNFINDKNKNKIYSMLNVLEKMGLIKSKVCRIYKEENFPTMSKYWYRKMVSREKESGFYVDFRTKVYSLTEKGLQLADFLIEIQKSDKN